MTLFRLKQPHAVLSPIFCRALHSFSRERKKDRKKETITRERWESWIIAHEHQPKLEQRVFCSVPPLPALNYLFKWEHWEIRGGVGGQLVKHAFKFFRCLKKTFESPLQQVFTARMVFIAQSPYKEAHSWQTKQWTRFFCFNSNDFFVIQQRIMQAVVV